ncbi:hypothetical protein [Catellatospora sichuanensis]|nr:hypothetical protein [Catellatospora sichuanensis]
MNPVPVAVAVLPVGGELLGVRRTIPPGAGPESPASCSRAVSSDHQA